MQSVLLYEVHTKGDQMTTSKRTSRSFRARQEAWDAAKERAESEGTLVTVAIEDLLEGYAAGHYDLPVKKTVKTYGNKGEDRG